MKIKRKLHNITSLKVHLKTHKKEGARHKYSIHIQAIAPTIHFESSNATDYDLASACHKAFKDLEFQIPHNFKDDVMEKGESISGETRFE